jgi:hypothetical protein
MTRTRITAADGTTYEATTARRRKARRITSIVATIASLPFLGAAVIGLAHASDLHTPSKHSLAILAAANKANGNRCHLEWNEAQGDHEAICDAPTPRYTGPAVCAKVPTDLRGVCADLAARKATANDPAGPALVRECTEQYKGDELIYCLTQPEN